MQKLHDGVQNPISHQLGTVRQHFSRLGTCRDNSGLAMTLPLVGNPYICNNSDRQPTQRQHVFRSTIQFSFETDVGRDSDGAERSEALALNLSCILASKHRCSSFISFCLPGYSQSAICDKCSIAHCSTTSVRYNKRGGI